MNKDIHERLLARGFLPGAYVRHFKHKGSMDGLNRIKCLAEHTETGEVFVIYHKIMDDSHIYARPGDMFLSKVDREKYPDAEQEYRFEVYKNE